MSLRLVAGMGRFRPGSYGDRGRAIHRLRRWSLRLWLCVLLVPFLTLTGAVADARAEPIRIVAFGDSLVAGYELPAGETFPARLQRALQAKGIAAEVENAGVSGDTASAGLARLDWSIPDGTDAVIVELGANDMLRGVDPDITRKALDEILQNLKSRNIPVLLAGMRAAPNLGADYVRRFETIYDELAKKHDVIFYPFFLDGIAANPKLALRDGLHPNAAGVDVIVQGILPKVEELIAKASAKRNG